MGYIVDSLKANLFTRRKKSNADTRNRQAHTEPLSVHQEDNEIIRTYDSSDSGSNLGSDSHESSSEVQVMRMGWSPTITKQASGTAESSEGVLTVVTARKESVPGMLLDTSKPIKDYNRHKCTGLGSSHRPPGSAGKMGSVLDREVFKCKRTEGHLGSSMHLRIHPKGKTCINLFRQYRRGILCKQTRRHVLSNPLRNTGVNIFAGRRERYFPCSSAHQRKVKCTSRFSEQRTDLTYRMESKQSSVHADRSFYPEMDLFCFFKNASIHGSEQFSLGCVSPPLVRKATVHISCLQVHSESITEDPSHRSKGHRNSPVLVEKSVFFSFCAPEPLDQTPGNFQ